MDNTLNLQITVTDEQMTSLLKGKLESLPDEIIKFDRSLKPGLT